jgi:hypothetical protein
LLFATVLAAPFAANAAPAPRAIGNTVLTIDPERRAEDLARAGWELDGPEPPRAGSSWHMVRPDRCGATVEAKDPMGKTIQLKLAKGHVAK